MALGDKWKKIRGIVGTIFQLGLGGPNLKNNSGTIQTRNAADSAFANLHTQELFLNDDDTNKVTIKAPDALGADYTLELPADDGSPGQALTTNGSGVLEWQSVDTGNDKIITDTTALAFGSSSPVTMFTLPANAVIWRIRGIVDTAFNGTAPTASIGISGTTSKYMAANEIDLKTVGIYEVEPGIIPVGSTENLIITYAADSSSAGAARFIVEYSIPS